MLRGLRTVSSNWFGKSIMTLLFGVLIVSFGVWGIADIFKGFGQSTLATIGKTEISIEQFRSLYNDRLQQISRQFGRPLNTEQARAIGVDRQVLNQTIAEALLDEQARRLGLAQSDAEIVRAISSDPTFAGLNGKFDPQRFALALRQFGYTEPRYIAEQRRVSLRRELAGSYVTGLEPSKTQLDALTRFQNEQRTIDYVKLGPDQAGKIDTPTPEVLNSYFEERKAMFRAPEYRKIAFLTITPDELAKKIIVTDDEARKEFDRRRDDFVKPERRQILQIPFPSADAAKAASDRITGGLSFEDLAKEMNLGPSDIDLGLVAKNGIGDAAVSDAAFALPLNKVSQPIKSTLATLLLKVVKIEPGTSPSYESMADTIKRQIAADRARASFQDIRDKIEDERGGGANIAEAAKKLGLDAVTIEAVDRSGRAPDSTPVSNLPKGADLLAPAFASNVGVENDPITVGGGEIWFDVLGVTPSRERSFNEVKDQVATRWRDDQIAERLRAKATDLTDKLNKGGSFADETAKLGLKRATSAPFKRDATINGLPEQVADLAFRTAKDAAAQAQASTGSDWVVFKVTDITVPSSDPSSDDAKKLKDVLVRSLTDEVIAQYVANLESDIGVKINQNAFAVATGAANSNQ